MQNKTKIWLGVGACVLTSVAAASAIASQNDTALNQLSPINFLSNAANPANSSVSNNNSVKPIVLMSPSGFEYGEQGEVGEKGEQGEQGERGERGEQGEYGDDS
ncbi:MULTISPECIES: hypothetical protein [unclassified Microcoleus]|uniref:hypothetical protein n=1 Tax=unclassified Microcoleus TaxID=2642155 RepID=UPI002FCF2687